MKITDHFELSEFETSATAKRYKIDNTVPYKYMDNIFKLCENVLEPIRQKWGGPINITSGYRSQRLNSILKGAENSDHKYGAAADIKPANGDVKGLFNLIYSMIKAKEISVRQLIDESGYKWVHISINNNFNRFKNNEILHLK